MLAPGGWCAGPYLGPAAPVPPLGLQRQLAPRRALWCLPAATEGIHLHSASTPPLTLPLTLPRCLSRQHDHAARRAARQGRHEPLTPERESAACSHVTMSAALYTTSQPTNHVCVCAAHRRMCTCICAHADALFSVSMFFLLAYIIFHTVAHRSVSLPLLQCLGWWQPPWVCLATFRQEVEEGATRARWWKLRPPPPAPPPAPQRVQDYLQLCVITVKLKLKGENHS